MHVPRQLREPARELFARYPVITITGPRQAGKTTLCREAFPEAAYANLEAPDRRQRAIDDPRGFLEAVGTPAIIDEIQRAPEIVSYIQERVDETGRNGQFVLTGSTQLRVTAAVSQSLAGRTAILRLLPLSIHEALELRPDVDNDAFIHTGFYPRIYDQGLDPVQALGDYFETYVERDVRQVSEIRNLTSFRTFVGLCAGRVGQLLNLQSLGNDAGVSHTTAREWISVLEASYLVFRLPPLHANVSKRLVKSPKLYFYDVGLAAYLIGIESDDQIFTHPLKGALFENLVVMEALKMRYNRGRRSNLAFYRDSNGNEVDLVCSFADRLVGIEIKAGATLAGDYFKGLERLSAALPRSLAAKMLVYGGADQHVHRGVTVTSPRGFAASLGAVAEELSRT